MREMDLKFLKNICLFVGNSVEDQRGQAHCAEPESKSKTGMVLGLWVPAATVTLSFP